jgi:signal transduction histidine kinase
VAKIREKPWAKALAILALVLFSALTALLGFFALAYVDMGMELFYRESYNSGILGSTLYDIAMVLDSVRDALPVLAVLSGVLALAALVFLLYSAGHKPGVEGVALNWQDKIPLDLYLVAALCLFCLGIAVGGDQALSYLHLTAPSAGTELLLLVGICFGALLSGFTALATLMTLATRLKLGRWWENTVCFWLLRLCRKLWRWGKQTVREALESLPMTWQAVALTAGVLLVQSILLLWTWESGIFFLLLALLDGGLLVGVARLMMDLGRLRDMGKSLAAGDLEAKLDTGAMRWEVKAHGDCLNAIGAGMNRAVEQRLRSERLKTELITNVSHDIKTPLTSIVSYVDLLKKEDLPEKASEYVAVLDRQSARLKKLTEDLVEASKASTGNVSVHLQPIVVNEILHQAMGDYEDRLNGGRLEVVLNTYEGNLEALADGRLLWRVLDNLLSNVCKYALAGTRVYVDLGVRGEMVFLEMKNISRDPLNIDAGELTERFVRGDASRHTEGSGLGLNIAKSLMDLMGGGFTLSVDGDLFKATLTLPPVASHAEALSRNSSEMHHSPAMPTSV